MPEINDDIVADPNAEPPIWDDEEVDWADEVGDDAEPESEGDAGGQS